MKRLLVFALLFAQFFSIAQDLKNNSYYYKGEQIPLEVNYNSFFIVANTLPNLGTIFQQYGYAIDTVYGGTEGDPVDSVMYWQVVKVNNSTLNLSSYDALRNNLKNNHQLTVEPVLGTSVLRPFSHYFNIRLENIEDTITLDSMSNAMGTTMVDCISEEFLWYRLKASSNSTGNSLEMANLFYETGLFKDIDAGFIYFFEPATCTTVVSLDQDYNQQWALDNPTHPNFDINICNAWGITTGNNNVKVAIIDRGLHIDTWPVPQPEYGNNLSLSTNSYDAETGLTPAFCHDPHGMPSAGIIAANHNNKKIMGIAPNTTLMDISHPLKWSGKSLKASLELADGFKWARLHGADIINNSWGDGNADVKSPTLNTEIDAALTQGRGGKGCTVIFASHNSGSPTVPYPANEFPKVICVGGIQEDGRRYHPSNGGGSNYGPDLDVVAPGARIYSTYGVNLTTHESEMIYEYGTSYAAPHVAGVAALMLAVNSCLTEEEVRTIIEVTASPINPGVVGANYSYSPTAGRPNGPWNNEMGYGLLDATAAVTKAQSVKSGKDLYIKDQPTDVGLESNPNGIDPYFTSDDIWVRNHDDGIKVHQNPDYFANTDHAVWVYVRVRNRGCANSTGDEMLNLYWAKGNAGATWQHPWNGLLANGNPQLPPYTGGQIKPTPTSTTVFYELPVIAARSETIIKFKWILPNPMDYGLLKGMGYFHFCLLARITDIVGGTDNISGSEAGVLINNIRNYNNIALKNVSVIDFSDPGESGLGMMADHAIVEVGNYSADNTLVANLSFAAADYLGNPITDEAEVRVILDDNIWNIWQSSGAESVGFTVENATEHVLLATDASAKLTSLQFNADTRGKVAVKINFLTEEVSAKQTFNYDVVQEISSDNSVIGGNRLVIIKPTRTEGEMFTASGQYNSSSPSTIDLNANSISEPASYKWYTLDTTLVDTGMATNVAPTQNTTYLLEVTADEDGYKDYAEVNVPAVTQNYITSLSPNPATSSVTASYHLDTTVTSASLQVVAANNPTQTLLTQTLNVQQAQVTVNTSSLQPGIYIVNLVCGGNIKDGEQLVIQ